MNTKQLNDRLWTIAKFGVPTVIVLLVITVLLKFRVLVIATDLLGLIVLGSIVLAILTEIVLHIEKRDVEKRNHLYGEPDEGPADR